MATTQYIQQPFTYEPDKYRWAGGNDGTFAAESVIIGRHGLVDSPSTVSDSEVSGDTKAAERTRSRRRCWIICAVITLIILALSAAGITVAYFQMPQIAQSFMDGSTLEFQEITISEPTEEGFTSRIVGRISNAGPFSAQTKPMQMIVYHNDKAIGGMEMPAMELKFGAADLDVESEFVIDDAEAFKEFSKELVTGEGFEWRIVGKTDLQVMGLALEGLDFDKTVNLEGMNNFPEVELKSFSLSTGRGNRNIRTDISTDMTNPSKINMKLPALELTMYYEGQPVGEVLKEDVEIMSGLNSLDMVGALSNTDQSDTARFSRLFTNYVTSKPSIVTVVGKRKSDRVPEWLSFALSQMKLDIELVPPDGMELIKDVRVSGMTMDFTGANQMAPVIAIDRINVDFEMPFEFPIQISRIRQTFIVSSAAGVVGRAETEFLPASNRNSPTTINTNLPRTELVVPPTSGGAFSDFMIGTFRGDATSFGMSGIADVRATTALGPVTLSGVTFADDIGLKGMQGLQVVGAGLSSNPEILRLDVVGGSSSQIQMVTDLVLYSASDVEVRLGDSTLFLSYEGMPIGRSLLSDLVVKPGENRIRSTVIYAPQSDEAIAKGQEMISNHIAGRPVRMEMRGTAESTSHPLLKETMNQMQMSAPLAGLTEPLVSGATLKINPLTVLFNKKGTSRFQASNPFSAPFTIRGMQAEITFNGKTLATIDTGDLNITIPPKTSTLTTPVPVLMQNLVSRSAISALRRDIGRGLQVDVVAKISARIGEYPIVIDYNQESLPSDIQMF